MAQIRSRQELKDYCLRRLGYPVIEINVSEDQIEDRIADAFQYYTDYHYDAVETMYWKHEVTQQDIENKYLTVDDGIIGITRLFPLSSTWTKSYMWDIRYQLRLHELWDFTSVNMLNYTMTMQHLRSLELLFSGEIPIRYQRHTDRVYLDLSWGSSELPEGTVIVLEGYKMIDPEVYTKVYDDRWIKRYATAQIKRQWGENLRKFRGITLPGGVQLNGDSIYEDARTEIIQLETEMQNSYELPPQFMIG
jgi:hypothetical protein